MINAMANVKDELIYEEKSVWDMKIKDDETLIDVWHLMSY